MLRGFVPFRVSSGVTETLMRVSLPVRVPAPDLPIGDDIEHSDDVPDQPDGGAEAIAVRSHAAAFIAGRRSEVT